MSQISTIQKCNQLKYKQFNSAWQVWNSEAEIQQSRMGQGFKVMHQFKRICREANSATSEAHQTVAAHTLRQLEKMAGSVQWRSGGTQKEVNSNAG